MIIEPGTLDNRATHNDHQSIRFEIKTSFPAGSFTLLSFLEKRHRYCTMYLHGSIFHLRKYALKKYSFVTSTSIV